MARFIRMEEVVASNEEVRHFVKIQNSDEWVEVLNRQWPDGVLEVFTLHFNAAHQPIAAYWSPVSESGDWNHTTRYYFDASGSVFCVSDYTYFFSYECQGNAIYHQSTRVYEEPQVVLCHELIVQDHDGNTIDPKRCVNPYTFDRPTLWHIDEVFTLLGIQ